MFCISNCSTLHFSMDKQLYFTRLSFFSGKLVSTKITTFSNLPYSTFKTSTLLSNSPARVKVKYAKFKFRNTIVSLRAPKHFKVGRQHYSLGSRFGYFNLKNKNREFNLFSNKAELASVVFGVFNAMNTPIQQPLTNLKTIKTEVSLQFKVKSII